MIYSYKSVQQSSYIVAIDVAMDFGEFDITGGRINHIANDCYLWTITWRPSIEERNFAIEGCRMLSPYLKAGILRVVSCSYVAPNYQPEGLVPAFAGVVANIFKAPIPSVSLIFNENEGRYVIK